MPKQPVEHFDKKFEDILSYLGKEDKQFMHHYVDYSWSRGEEYGLRKGKNIQIATTFIVSCALFLSLFSTIGYWQYWSKRFPVTECPTPESFQPSSLNWDTIASNSEIVTTSFQDNTKCLKYENSNTMYCVLP